MKSDLVKIFFFAACLAVASNSSTRAQQTSTNGGSQAPPSKAETTEFILDKLSGLPELNYVSQITAPGTPFDPSKASWLIYSKIKFIDECTLQFHSDTHVPNNPTFSSNQTISFRNVTDLRVRSLDAIGEEDIAAMGHPGFVSITVPKVYVLRAHSKDISSDILFSDETIAIRLAKAFSHMATLCGAVHNKEPF